MFSTSTYGESTTRLAFLNFKWTEITARHIFKCITPHLVNKSDLISVSVHRTTSDTTEQDEELVAVAHFTSAKIAEHIYISLDGVEIENTGSYFDARFLHKEVGEKISVCTKEPLDIVICDVWEEEDMERKNLIMNLFDDEEDEGIDSEIVNDLVEMSDDEPPAIKLNEESVNEEIIQSSSEDEESTDKENLKGKKGVNKKSKKQIKENHAQDAKRKSRKSRKPKNVDSEDKEFTLNLKDERLTRIFDDDEFKVDVTHNLYKNNSGVKEVVREKRRRRDEKENLD